MPGQGPPLPSRAPCMCRAIYSWGGETKRDLGFVEGDLIEYLNAGDGQWWMGRLKRNKTVGLFPSNFVEVLEDYDMSPSRPVSRGGGATSPMYGGSISRGASPAPGQFMRAPSPQPQDYYGESTRSRERSRSPRPQGRQGGSWNSRTGRSPSPIPYHPGPQTRASSPNPYARGASPHPYAGSPAPQDYRAASPNPSHYHRSGAVSPSYQRSASPNPYPHDNYQGQTAPPAPPPHRYAGGRGSSPGPPQDGRHTPNPSRGPSPSILGNTPSPLRSAMDDVLESLEHMSNYDDRPRTPTDPWAPAAFEQVYQPSPKRGYARPETSLGIAGRNDYEEEEDENGMPIYPAPHQRPYSVRMDSDKVENALRMFAGVAAQRQPLADHDEYDLAAPPPPPKNFADRTMAGDSTLRKRKSIFDLHADSPSPASSSRMHRPRPLSRNTTVKSAATSNNSSTSNATTSTAATSASIMSGMSAGGFSATSAGSLARRKRATTAMDTHVRSPTFGRGGAFSAQTGPPSASGSGYGSQSRQQTLHKRGQTWGAGELDAAVLGGLSTPKPKKTGFFKKLLAGAKASAASARGVADGSSQHYPAQYQQKAIPDGVTPILGGRMAVQEKSVDWMQVRRDINRSNTLSRNERIERLEKQQMMEQPVLRPVDALDEDVDGDEAADGGIVENAQEFETPSLALVDKAARFVGSIPPLTSPENLACHYICRPYRSDVQRLRAIFTWVSEKIAWEHPTGPNGEAGADGVDARRVLSQKRGSPEEVAVLVLRMCQAVNIPCEVIRGYLKAPGEDIDVQSVPRPNHFWNAVLVEGEYRFLDCSLASATHPRRVMYSAAPASIADVFYFLTKPCHLCWTHVPLQPEHQHMVPPLPMCILLALPVACPAFFRTGIQMINYDTSLTRIEDLEVVQIEFSVPVNIECVAEVEANGFAIDQDGDVFETGEVVKKRALAQVVWENGMKTYRIKAVLPGDEGQGVLKIYAGKRGLMHSIKDNPHPLALAIPITHEGENPPYDFLIRHPTPHAQRHDLYVSQPQCSRLAINNTFVFAVCQHPSEGPVGPDMQGPKPAKLGIQTPSGKIMRLMKKADTMGCENGMVWETIIKCGERGPWRALVLADRSARWCVYAEWMVV